MTTSRVALVTGGNKGIGLETCRQLAGKGYTVLLAAREASRGEAAAKSLAGAGRDVRFIQLDVTSGESITKAALEIERQFGRLDVLINNAGVFPEKPPGAPSTVSQQVLRETFETNFFGLIAVTQAMLPLVRKSDAGRIVNLTSILGSLSEHSDPKSQIYGMMTSSYNASKAALNMYTVNLARELKDTPIKVNAAHPGWVKTDMGGPGAPLEVPEGAETSVWLATLPADGPTGGYFHRGNSIRW